MTSSIVENLVDKNTGGTGLEQNKEHSFIAKISAVLLVLLVVMHTILIATWVAPNNLIQETIGRENLRSYIMPIFDQNWSIFAPNPTSSEVNFEVRAYRQNPATGEETPTEWVNLTSEEDKKILHTPTPPRTANMTRRITDRLHSSRKKMSQDQLDLLDRNFLGRPPETMREQLHEEDGASPSEVDTYMRFEEAAVQVATAVAQNTWGDDILYVQIRTAGRTVPDYADRHEKTLEDVEWNWRSYGWRTPASPTEQELHLFTQYFDQKGNES